MRVISGSGRLVNWEVTAILELLPVGRSLAGNAEIWRPKLALDLIVLGGDYAPTAVALF